MTVSAFLGMGSRHYYSSDGVNYTELTDMVEIGSPDDPSVEEIDATPLNPTSNAAEFLFGLITYGETSFKQYWTKTRFTTLRGLLRTSTPWRTVFPDNATVANASKIEYTAAPKMVRCAPLVRNQPIVIEVTSKITGATTFTPGT